MVPAIPLQLSEQELINLCVSSHHSIHLDSGSPYRGQQRYSYFMREPEFVLQGIDDPWPCLLAVEQEELSFERPLPFFCGGLVGFLGYESARFLEGAPVTFHHDSLMPDYWFGFYRSVVVKDHWEGTTFVTGADLSEQELIRQRDVWMDRARSLPTTIFNDVHASRLIQGPDRAQYEQQIQLIKDYLHAGDVYQVNLTDRYLVHTERSPAQIYAALRQVSPAPFGAYIHTGDFQIYSASPELLLDLHDGLIRTKPIKGTCDRYGNADQDRMAQDQLLGSAKDRAELLMIIDLERNDLGKVCKHGGVEAQGEPHLETFSHCHHLVSEVKGRLKPEVSAVQALMALFPGGSVTGAPKRHAMEIIYQLEAHPRKVYTGALGYLGHGGRAQFNLPIRTMTGSGHQIMVPAGGGIVADSVASHEYKELELKAQGLLEALGCRF